jgi:hypothetical protein
MSGGTINVLSGGSLTSATINNGVANLSGGTANATTLVSGGMLEVLSGASATITKLSAGGTQQVALGGYEPPPVPDRPRALVVDAQVPVLGHDGGSNAVLDHIRALQNAGFAVSFFGLDGADQDLKALSSLGVPLLRGAFSEVARQHAGQFDLVYLHRVATATCCLKAARQYFDAQVVYSVADLHHLRVKAESLLDHARSPALIEQAQNLALQEIAAALSADCVVTHSVSEAEQLRQIPSLATARKVRVIPWALAAAPVRLPFGKRSGLAFIGGFAHAPNVDAARWLVHEIMPLVWHEAPEVECLIAGSDLTDDLHQELAQPCVTVLGRVGQLSDVFSRAADSCATALRSRPQGQGPAQHGGGPALCRHAGGV